MVQQAKVGSRVAVPFGQRKTYTAIITSVHTNAPQGYRTKAVLELLDDFPVVTEKQFKFWKWIAHYYLCTLGELYKAAVPQGLKGEFKPRTETRVRFTTAFKEEKEMHNLLDSLKRAVKQCNIVHKFIELSHSFSDNSLVEVTKKELLDSSNASAQIFNNLVAKGVFETYEYEIGRLHDTTQKLVQSNPLNKFQAKAFDEIEQAFDEKNVCLLHGVTSSGKTEIYIHWIQKMLAEGKQVLYLLPEIALTQQITCRLQQVFGSRVGIYHSKFSDAERVEVWNKQLSDTPYEVILGVRSSVFLPFQRLGLVIVDEEHENTYKQQDPAPRYNARNAALVLASMFGAKALLGTATPCVESYYNATTGKYALVQLNERYQSFKLPDIEVVDIKDLAHRKQMYGPFSPLLLDAIRAALEQHRQIILFQNRRGYAPLMECRVCGWTPRCKNCDVTLTYHKRLNRLTCHYCGYSTPVPLVCPACEESNFQYVGFGTEKIEDSIHGFFPEARLARMDLDTTRTRTSYEKIITDFQEGKTDILIGTQMVSKGLDFDNVSVVGILNADSMLNYPDFRAGERAFQLMAQVAGRAGRKNKSGRVILQTKSPDLPIIAQVTGYNFLQFYNQQLSERLLFHYPPYYRLVYIYLKHRSSQVVDEAANTASEMLRTVFGSRVLGPDQPPVSRVQQLFIRKIVLKIETRVSIYKVHEQLKLMQQKLFTDEHFRGVTLYYDVDPQS